MASSTVKEVGIGTFAKCGISFANLPPYATQDIYTFVGGEGEMIPAEVVRVVIDETIDEIKPYFDLFTSDMTHLEIRSKNITIRRDAFNRSWKLQEIVFHVNGTFDIEQDAFNSCTALLRLIKWPKGVELIHDGSFGIKTLPGDRLPIPTMHRNAFFSVRYSANKKSIVAQYCRRYSYLCRFWKWIDSRERHHRNNQADCPISELDCLCPDDIDMLQQVLKLVPPAPNDLIDAIINDLHSYDCLFKKIPQDIIWQVVEYIPGGYNTFGNSLGKHYH